MTHDMIKCHTKSVCAVIMEGLSLIANVQLSEVSSKFVVVDCRDKMRVGAC